MKSEQTHSYTTPVAVPTLAPANGNTLTSLSNVALPTQPKIQNANLNAIQQLLNAGLQNQAITQPPQQPTNQMQPEVPAVQPHPVDLGNGYVVVPISLANQFATQIAAAMLAPSVAQTMQMTALNHMTQQQQQQQQQPPLPQQPMPTQPLNALLQQALASAGLSQVLQGTYYSITLSLTLRHLNLAKQSFQGPRQRDPTTFRPYQ